MALELVTGYWGQQHVTAEQDADLNAGIIGREPCILRVGENMRAEAVTANKVRIFDGIFVGYGRVCAIDEGAYEDVEIENGTAGLLRNDMIVIKYVKDEATGIEGVSLAVLKGQTGETATDPTPNNQDIRTGAFESEMPLYRVRLNGLAIEAVERICEMPRTIKDLTSLFGQLNSNLNAANFTLTNSTYYPTTSVIVSGRVMQLQCAGLILKDVPANSEFVIGTLPAAYRPSYKIIKYVLGGGTTSRLFRISIDVDGKVTYTPTADIATGVGVNINETFIAKPS
ncbi:hypothetical protein [Faecalicatena contorta]|uniref:hypothetical protein n=2 Tax=Faecalicatena contorta TaxID=39482 RepID=UPI003217AF71